MTPWHALISEHAALEDADESVLRGADLRSAIDRRADEMRASGVDEGDWVTMARRRSSAWVVDLIALARVGAIVVPIDPNTPEARRRAIAKDAKVAFTIDDRSGLVRASEEKRDRSPHEELAFVIYTSGSSGTPKGVRVGPSGLVRMLRAQISAFELDPSARVLAYLSPGFDAFLSDVFTALLSGATLCFEREERLASIADLTSVLHERRITHLDFPPSLVPHLVLDALAPSLRCMIIGGEAAPIDALRALARRVRVVNVYGPTEATICTSLCVVDPERWSRPLLGQPLPGVQYRVVNEELWIASDGLAHGYVDREEETRGAFVVEDGVRWYRTGDRVERCGEEWVFLGRVDRQVKVAGVRIELEEIEAILSAQEGVRAAAVVKRSEGLIAFVEGGRASELSSALRATLPRAALPKRIVALQELPRTTSGKLDRAALERVEIESSGLVGGQPQSDDERLVAALFERVLMRRDIGRGASFWDEGGDSFAVLELCALASAMGIFVSPAWLAQSCTVEELARTLRMERGERAFTIEAVEDEAVRMLADAPQRSGSRSLDEAIVVTGATGFLGARVLSRLCERSDRPLVCLVRARSDDEARARVTAALENARVGSRNIRAIAVDLAEPTLGLSENAYDGLASAASLVVHCAGSVRVTSSWRELARANVRTTAHLVRFVERCDGRLVHASSLAPFVCCELPPSRIRETPNAPQAPITGAYAASKWAAERVIGISSVDSVIVRFGLLTGDSRTGLSHDACQLSLFLRSLAAIGVAPQIDAPLACDITPVDSAARAMVDLALAPDARGVFHVAGPEPASFDALLAALSDAGASLPRVSSAEFFDAITSAVSARGAVSTAALGLSRRLRASATAIETDLFLASSTRFDTARTEAFTDPIPNATPELLARYAKAALA